MKRLEHSMVNYICLFISGKVRLFAFIRLDFEEKGPETIKRTKFVLLSWIGQDVANEKRQRVHGDRDCIKSVIKVCMQSIFYAEFSKQFGRRSHFI